MSNLIRVLLADDHPLIRAGIGTTLNNDARLIIVGEAVNGEETCRLCQSFQPDVLLLDLHMPGSRPVEIIAYLRQHCPKTKIVILTAYDDDIYVHNLMAIGVEGYILKDEAVETIVNAVLTVAKGNTSFSQSVIQKLTQQRKSIPDMTPLQKLSEREQQILILVARGWNNQRIAHELALAVQTIRNTVSRIYNKLGIKSRSEAVIWARERGLVEEKSP